MPSPSRHQTDALSIKADGDCLEAIREFIRSHAEKSGLDSLETGRLVLAVDEASSNILEHSYHFQKGHKIGVRWTATPDRWMVELQDDNPDPQLPASTDFSLPTKIQYRQRGGFGTHMMKSVVDELHYSSQPGKGNTVSLIKYRQALSGRPAGSAENILGRDRARSHAYASLVDAGQRFASLQDPRRVLELFFYSVMGQTAARPMSLLLRRESDGLFELLGHMGFSKKLSMAGLAITQVSRCVEALLRLRRPVSLQEMREELRQDERMILEHLECSILVPLFSQESLEGLVTLGPKRTKRPFQDEELKLVSFLGSHLVLMVRQMKKSGKTFRESASVHASLVWALAELRRVVSDEAVFRFQVEESSSAMARIGQEKLGRLLLTLLVHIVYLATENSPIKVSFEEDQGEVVVWMDYLGEPLATEPGQVGYNPVIDRLLSGGYRLKDVRKEIEAWGASLLIHKGEKNSVELSLPIG